MTVSSLLIFMIVLFLALAIFLVRPSPSLWVWPQWLS